MENNNIQNVEDLPESFVTAQNLDPIERLEMQAAWQNRIDASISSTVNLINKTTTEEVENIYLKAWELGLKGVTVYRSGCAREGILTLTNENEKEVLELPRGKLKSIVEDTIYYPKNLRIGCGKLKVMIGYSPSENKIQDLYVIRSGSGGCEKNIQAVAIFMSGMLRLGGNLFMLEKSIEGISGCPAFARGNAIGKKLSKGDTCPLAILNILKEFESEMGLKDFEKAQAFIKQKEEKFNENIDEIKSLKAICPDCGEVLEISGGCYSCRACGYSKCD
jgi:ribonucleoside-diphosphate reductase alpha chain